MIKVVISDEKFSFYAEATFNTMEEAKVFAKCHPLAKDPHIVRFLQLEDKKPITPEEIFKFERQKILLATDWLFLPDVVLEPKEKKAFLAYRQYLRDLGRHKIAKIEDFEHWLRRNHPEEFMDGGRGEKIVAKFKSYY